MVEPLPRILDNQILSQSIVFGLAVSNTVLLVVKMDTLGCGGKVGIRGRRAPYWGCTWHLGGEGVVFIVIIIVII